MLSFAKEPKYIACLKQTTANILYYIYIYIYVCFNAFDLLVVGVPFNLWRVFL